MQQPTKKKITARWNIQLLVECPYCHEEIDLIQHPNFKDDWYHFFGLYEPRKLDLTLLCPHCELEFSLGEIEC